MEWMFFFFCKYMYDIFEFFFGFCITFIALYSLLIFPSPYITFIPVKVIRFRMFKDDVCCIHYNPEVAVHSWEC